jgi:hypothetical protein
LLALIADDVDVGAAVFKPAESAIGDAKCQCQNASASIFAKAYVKCHVRHE